MSQGAVDMLRATIEAGGYDLAYMIGIIDRYWMEGNLDATERDSVKEYARERAVPEDSFAPDRQRLLQLENAMSALEARVAALEGGSGGGDTPVDPTDEWPEFVQPTGAHDAYHIGDKITFNGKHYVSLLDGNVWSPAVYPAGWQEQTATSEVETPTDGE